MKRKPVLSHLWIFLGLGCYLALFFAVRLPGLEGVRGGVFRRYELFRWFLQGLLLPESLVELWCGKPPELALLDRLPVLAVAVVILGCGWAAGWLLMRAFGLDRGLARLEVFVFSTAVGLNVVSTYTLLVGLAGLLGNRLLVAGPVGLALVVGLAMAGRDWLTRENGDKWAWLEAGWAWLTEEGQPREDAKKRRGANQGKANVSGVRGSSAGRETGHDRGETDHTEGNRAGEELLSGRWLWLAAPFVLVMLLGGMLPPIEFDVREYHLQVPKEFYRQGSVGFLLHNVYGNMPMGTEMLSLLAMVLAGDWWLGALAGKTVTAIFAALTALGLLAAGRRFVSPTAGIVAAVLYVSIPWIVQVSNLGLVEGASACYLFLVVYALMLEKRGVSRFLLAGFLAGGAVACKYPAVLFVVVPLAAWILVKGYWEVVGGPARRSGGGAEEQRSGMRFLTPLLPAGVFLLAAAVTGGAWFAKNWAFTGNPTYPLLYGVFGDRTGTWTPEKDRQWNAVHRPTDFSARTLAKDTMRVAVSSDWLSPLVVPLAALAFLVPRRRRTALVLVIYIGFVIAAWWLLTHRIDRFWIPTLPLFALLAGIGACWSGEPIWRRALVVLLVLGCGSNLLIAATGGAGYTRYFVALARLRAHPERVDPWHRYFNAHAADGCVLSVGDAQVFDLEMPVFYNTCFDDSLLEEIVAGRSAEEIRGEFSARGITHVYVHWGEIARYRGSGNYGYTEFVQPEVFERLVEERLLEPLPPIERHPGRAYRVVP